MTLANFLQTIAFLEDSGWCHSDSPSAKYMFSILPEYDARAMFALFAFFVILSFICISMRLPASRNINHLERQDHLHSINH